MSDVSDWGAAPNLKEFRDTRLWVQYSLGGIAGAGIVGAITLFRKAGDAPHFLIAAGAVLAAMLVALAVIYLRFAKPIVLRQTETGVERICGDDVQKICYDELAGLRAKWTDVWRNGVYDHTLVNLAFSSHDANAPLLKFDSTVSYDTLKYKELQEFQCEVAELVAARMAAEMHEHGIVPWTDKLAIHRDGVELTRKAGAAPEVIGFDRISEWKVDDGLFKLGVDGSRAPVLVEGTDQWNFYPGLLLFSQLCQSSGDCVSVAGEQPALVH